MPYVKTTTTTTTIIHSILPWTSMRKNVTCWRRQMLFPVIPLASMWWTRGHCHDNAPTQSEEVRIRITRILRDFPVVLKVAFKCPNGSLKMVYYVICVQICAGRHCSLSLCCVRVLLMIAVNEMARGRKPLAGPQIARWVLANVSKM